MESKQTRKSTKTIGGKIKARLADVANNTVIKIEAGKNQNPALDTLQKLSRALGVGVDDLIK